MLTTHFNCILIALLDKRNERKRLEESYIQVYGIISHFEHIQRKMKITPNTYEHMHTQGTCFA